MITQSREQFMSSWLKTPADWAGSSHLPVLAAAVSLHKRPGFVAIDAGGGCFSTDFLIQHTKHCLTIEHDPEWYRTLMAWYSNRSHWSCVNIPWDQTSPVQLKLLSKQLLTDVDILFIDGIVKSRAPTLAAFAHRASTIVIHDTENFTDHGYDSTYLSHFSTRLSFRPGNFPQTTIYTKNVSHIYLEDQIKANLGRFDAEPFNFFVE